MKAAITHNDDENEALLMHEIARQMKICFDRRALHLGLTRSQWRVLSVLRRHPGINQTKLAEHIEVEPITLVRLLDRMQKAGWIERRPHPEDRRANGIFLTPKVKGIVQSMRRIALDLRQEYLHDFSKKEHAELLSYLRRIKKNTASIISESKQ
jgi:MarR family transcriptional regulator for hemolysin